MTERADFFLRRLFFCGAEMAEYFPLQSDQNVNFEQNHVVESYTFFSFLFFFVKEVGEIPPIPLRNYSAGIYNLYL